MKSLKVVMDYVRLVRWQSTQMSKRNFNDFFADKIARALSEPNLMAFGDRLVSIVEASREMLSGETVKGFLLVANSPEAPRILSWLRKYHQIAAILTIMKKEDYEESIQSIEVQMASSESGVVSAVPEYTIPITMECLSPLSHGAETKAGNATLFRRMQVLSDENSVLELPFYAGNAFRGQMRDLLANDYLIRLGLTPNMKNPPVSLWFFHTLYAGGALDDSGKAKALMELMGKNGAERIDGVSQVRDAAPPVSLLGAAMGRRILGGRAQFGDYRPHCKQWGYGDIDVSSLMEWVFLTRRDDLENPGEGEHHGMIANTECLKIGTRLSGGIDYNGHITEIEMACLGHGLDLIEKYGYVGACSNRGLGKVKINISNKPDPTAYFEHMEKNRETILDLLKQVGALDKETESSPIKSGEISNEDDGIDF
jgi:hypothetical protein